MKKLILFLFLAVSLSCSNDDDSYIDAQLSGEWRLVNIYCYCGFDPAIDFNDFTLRFEKEENILHLDNPTESYFYIAESGSYKYNIEGNIITIKGSEASFKYVFEDANLILTLLDEPAIADDELSLVYERK